MYREAAAADPKELPPGELVVAFVDRGSRSSSIAMFQLFSIPAVVAAVLAVALNPTAGLVGLVASAAATYAWSKRRTRAKELVLRVAAGELAAATSRGEVRFRLTELDDVALDTKTIRSVHEGDSAIPAVRFTDTKVGPEVDVSRIELVGKGRRVPLSDKDLSHMDATEWAGKIRVFLRKHGWVPLDERAPADDDDDDVASEDLAAEA